MSCCAYRTPDNSITDTAYPRVLVKRSVSSKRVQVSIYRRLIRGFLIGDIFQHTSIFHRALLAVLGSRNVDGVGQLEYKALT